MSQSEQNRNSRKKQNLTCFQSFQLPATKELLGKSALDNEFKSDINSLSFIKKSKVKTSVENSASNQPNWTSLENSLNQNNFISKSSTKVTKSRNLRENNSDWHQIPEIKLTPELQRDLRIIENRQHLDPKRFYKSTGTGRAKGKLPTRVYVGTVIAGSHEFYSGRLTRQERKSRIMNEVLSDDRIVQYARRKMTNLQNSRQNGKRFISSINKLPKSKRR